MKKVETGRFYFGDSREGYEGPIGEQVLREFRDLEEYYETADLSPEQEHAHRLSQGYELRRALEPAVAREWHTPTHVLRVLSAPHGRPVEPIGQDWGGESEDWQLGEVYEKEGPRLAKPVPVRHWYDGDRHDSISVTCATRADALAFVKERWGQVSLPTYRGIIGLDYEPATHAVVLLSQAVVGIVADSNEQALDFAQQQFGRENVAFLTNKALDQDFDFRSAGQ